MAKEAKYNKQGTKAAKEAWQKKLRKNTGKATDGKDFVITDVQLEKALGPYWYQVLKEAERVGAINILAITAKSLRKTAIVKFIQHYLLAKHHWLHTQDLRRTKEQSSNVLIQSHLDALGFWAKEYGVPWLADVIQQASFKMYFVRDKKRKDNQEIEFSSFEAMRKIGGFTKPYVFHWEELVDPDSKGQAPTKDEFLYTFNLVKDKNRENFLTRGHIDVYNNTPTHFFTMNRWDTEHPLIQFAEAHAPWVPVKEWMLEDPENNNFYMQFIDTPEEGWEDLKKTLIVYGSKLASHIMVKDEEWKQEQLDLIASRDPEKLGTVLGDVFEGTSSSDNAYHYLRKDAITREEFVKDYAPYATTAYISVDLDFSRQIRIRPKYSVTKHVDVDIKIHRLIRDKAYKIGCSGVSSDGASTERYFKQTVEKLLEICDKIKLEMPKIKKVKILLDDKKAQWVGRFNVGDAQNAFWIARKITFDQNWRIQQRPADMDTAQDTGFMIDIQDKTNDDLHAYYKKMQLIEKSSNNGKRIWKQRHEKDRDAMVDDVNADEYPLFLEKPKMTMNNIATRKLGGQNTWQQNNTTT